MELRESNVTHHVELQKPNSPKRKLHRKENSWKDETSERKEGKKKWERRRRWQHSSLALLPIAAGLQLYQLLWIWSASARTITLQLHFASLELEILSVLNHFSMLMDVSRRFGDHLEGAVYRGVDLSPRILFCLWYADITYRHQLYLCLGNLIFLRMFEDELWVSGCTAMISWCGHRGLRESDMERILWD